jgi:hypothetical protein
VLQSPFVIGLDLFGGVDESLRLLCVVGLRFGFACHHTYMPARGDFTLFKENLTLYYIINASGSEVGVPICWKIDAQGVALVIARDFRRQGYRNVTIRDRNGHQIDVFCE